MTTQPVPIPANDLATLIAKTPINGVIKLANGVYPIRCDGTVIIKAGVTIRGESKTGVVIQRDDRWPANNQPVLKGEGDNITIENLTIDANAPEKGLSDYAYAGLHIFGTNARVENVRFIRPTGNLVRGVECWTCWIVSGEVLPSGMVSDCTVSDVRGDYVEGFSASGACTFRNCRVDFPVLANSAQPPFFNGFQGAGMSQFLNCIQTGGTGFFYTDTEDVAARFQGCLGLQLVRGIWVVVKPDQICDGLTIDGCEFQLTPGIAGDRYGLAVSGDGKIQNTRMVNTVVKYSPGLVAETEGIKYAGAVTNGKQTLFKDNLIDGDFRFAHDVFTEEVGTTWVARAPQAPIP